MIVLFFRPVSYSLGGHTSILIVLLLFGASLSDVLLIFNFLFDLQLLLLVNKLGLLQILLDCLNLGQIRLYLHLFFLKGSPQCLFNFLEHNILLIDYFVLQDMA